MFTFIKKLFGLPTDAEKAAAKVPVTGVKAEISAADTKPKRAKNSKGKFVADNPATEKNEAWVGGKAPAKKPKVKKPVAKKPAVKK
jgi:hypothetical protein